MKYIELSDKSKNHCISVGTDKKGIINCHKCPYSIQKACHSGSSGSAESIFAWRNRINLAVDEYYKNNG